VHHSHCCVGTELICCKCVDRLDPKPFDPESTADWVARQNVLFAAEQVAPEITTAVLPGLLHPLQERRYTSDQLWSVLHGFPIRAGHQVCRDECRNWTLGTTFITELLQGEQLIKPLVQILYQSQPECSSCVVAGKLKLLTQDVGLIRAVVDADAVPPLVALLTDTEESTDLKGLSRLVLINMLTGSTHGSNGDTGLLAKILTDSSLDLVGLYDLLSITRAETEALNGLRDLAG
jgi:hypothetical protein